MKTTIETPAALPAAIDAPGPNSKARLLNATIQHLQTVVARLDLAEQENPGGVYMLAAEREPLKELLAELTLMKSPLALLPDGRLACGNCGNADRDEIEISEYVFRTWSMPEIADDETDEARFVIDSGTDTVVWEASHDGEFLHCRVCDYESIIPANVSIDWK